MKDLAIEKENNIQIIASKITKYLITTKKVENKLNKRNKKILKTEHGALPINLISMFNTSEVIQENFCQNLLFSTKNLDYNTFLKIEKSKIVIFTVNIGDHLNILTINKEKKTITLYEPDNNKNKKNFCKYLVRRFLIGLYENFRTETVKEFTKYKILNEKKFLKQPAHTSDCVLYCLYYVWWLKGDEKERETIIKTLKENREGFKLRNHFLNKYF